MCCGSFIFFLQLLWLPFHAAALDLTLDPDTGFQTIRHFGSSAAFDLNEITDSWTETGKENLAKSIFSRETDAEGNPMGMGLSSFRVEIGACSMDQGGSSEISIAGRRAPCPLRPDGSYDWSQMEAETYWVDKAYEYGLELVFGYSNSPPVYFTKNGLACRTNDVPSANLREDSYDDFAEYLAQVAKYYGDRNTPLHYISPVNEPQWEWICDSQEGTMWHNTEIRDLVIAMDSVFQLHNLSTKVTLTEGGSIDRVYGFAGDPTGDQLRFWEPGNNLYIGDLDILAPYVASHGYWTEDTDQRLVDTRQSMAGRLGETDERLEWWQSEYSFLGDGYRDGRSSIGAIDYGLFLAKVIHHDLTLGQASGWQYWETFGSGNNLRYMLVQLGNQDATPAKTGWALAHYSFFIRPGMKRIAVQRSDNASPQEAVDGIMPSAYISEATGDLVVVIVNYEENQNSINLVLPGIPQSTTFTPYLTTSSNNINMARQADISLSEEIVLEGRSIITLVGKGIGELAGVENRGKNKKDGDVFSQITANTQGGKPYLVFAGGTEMEEGSFAELVDVMGKSILKISPEDVLHGRIALPDLSRGVHFLRMVNNAGIAQKALVL